MTSACVDTSHAYRVGLQLNLKINPETQELQIWHSQDTQLISNFIFVNSVHISISGAYAYEVRISFICWFSVSVLKQGQRYYQRHTNPSTGDVFVCYGNYSNKKAIEHPSARMERHNNKHLPAWRLMNRLLLFGRTKTMNWFSLLCVIIWTKRKQYSKNKVGFGADLIASQIPGEMPLYAVLRGMKRWRWVLSFDCWCILHNAATMFAKYCLTTFARWLWIHLRGTLPKKMEKVKIKILYESNLRYHSTFSADCVNHQDIKQPNHRYACRDNKAAVIRAVNLWRQHGAYSWTIIHY